VGEPWRRRVGGAAGFQIAATSATAPIAAMEAPDRQLYALLFHPEVAHTDYGSEILRNFAYGVCGCRGDWTIASFIEEATERIRQQVGRGQGGLRLVGRRGFHGRRDADHRAIGDRLTCIFVDNGLLRYDEANQISKRFTRSCSCRSTSSTRRDLFLERLRRVPTRAEAKISAPPSSTCSKRRERAGASIPRSGHAVSDVIESARCWSAVGHQESSQRRRLPRAHEVQAVEPLRDSVQGRSRRVGRDLGSNGVRRPAAVPGPAGRARWSAPLRGSG
jgi:GMP synthase (glutamine-hydrolysing)